MPLNALRLIKRENDGHVSLCSFILEQSGDAAGVDFWADDSAFEHLAYVVAKALAYPIGREIAAQLGSFLANEAGGGVRLGFSRQRDGRYAVNISLIAEEAKSRGTAPSLRRISVDGDALRGLLAALENIAGPAAGQATLVIP